MADLLFVGASSAPLWSVYDADGTRIEQPTLTGVDSPSGASAHGSLIALSHSGGTYGLTVVDSTDWSIVFQLTGSASAVCRFSPDGTRLAIAGAHGVKMYNTATWSLVAEDTSTDRQALVWKNDSSGLIASGSGSPQSRLYDKNLVLLSNSGDKVQYRLIDGFFLANNTNMVGTRNGELYNFDTSAWTFSYLSIATVRGLAYNLGSAVGYLASTSAPYARLYNPKTHPALSGGDLAGAPTPLSTIVAVNSDASRVAYVHSGGDGVTMYTAGGASKVTLSHALGSSGSALAWFSRASAPEYTLEPDTTTANEGDTVTFAVTAPTDDTLYYKITGDITADDIASGALTGTITITAGVGSLAVVLLEDGTLEGAEEFAVELYTDSGLTELVATSATVTVADTSVGVAGDMAVTEPVDSMSAYSRGAMQCAEYPDSFSSINHTSGTLALSETQDTAFIAGAITAQPSEDPEAPPPLRAGAIHAAEARDGFYSSGGVAGGEGEPGEPSSIGAIYCVEQADQASASGGVIVGGALSVSEEQDAGAIAGEVIVSGAIAATEAPDAISIASMGTVLGSLAATEASDTTGIDGRVAIAGTLAASELADSASITGAVIVSAAMTAIEPQDTAQSTGKLFVSGTLGATDQPDQASINGAVRVSGSLWTTESADSASCSGLVLIQGGLSTSESPDTVAIVGKVFVAGTLAANDSPDTCAAQGVAPVRGALGATEETDGLAAEGSVINTATGTIGASEYPDSLAASGWVQNAGAIRAILATLAAEARILPVAENRLVKQPREQRLIS